MHTPSLLRFAFACCTAFALNAQAAESSTPVWSTQAKQLVLVEAADWAAPSGELRRYEREDSGAQWQRVGEPQSVALGRTGSAWGIGLHTLPQPGPIKREGDGKSPAGAFAIGPAFGYAINENTALPYHAMQETDYCIDVPQSPLYNQLVDAAQVGKDAVKGSTEPMRLDIHNDGDPRYRIGFVIAHNPQNAPGAGSCIFAHLTRREGEATAGCTAMEDAAMQALLGWLDPSRDPVFVLLPQAELARLATAWGLPQSEVSP